MPAEGYVCAAGLQCKFDHTMPPTKEDIEKFEKPKTIAIISHYASVTRSQWNFPALIKSLPLRAAVLACQTDACKCGLVTVVKDTGAMKLDMPTLTTMGMNKRKAEFDKLNRSLVIANALPKVAPKKKAKAKSMVRSTVKKVMKAST
jgi:hypothetical protein